MTDRFRESRNEDTTTPAVSQLASRFEKPSPSPTTTSSTASNSVSSLASRFNTSTNKNNTSNNSRSGSKQPSVGDISRQFSTESTDNGSNNGFASAADAFRRMEKTESKVAAVTNRLDEGSKETISNKVAGVARSFESKNTQNTPFVIPTGKKMEQQVQKKKLFKEGEKADDSDEEVDKERFKNATKLFESGQVANKIDQHVEKEKEVSEAKNRFLDASKMFGG